MAVKRDRILRLRLRKDEYRCVYDKAHSMGHSVSEYVRSLILEDCKK